MEIKEFLIVYGAEDTGSLEQEVLSAVGMVPAVIHGWSSVPRIVNFSTGRLVFEDTNLGILPEKPQSEYLTQVSLGRAIQEAFQEKFIVRGEKAVAYVVRYGQGTAISTLQARFRSRSREYPYYKYSNNFILDQEQDTLGTIECFVASVEALVGLSGYPGLEKEDIGKYCILRGIRRLYL